MAIALGALVNPVPVTENLRIPDVDEILDAQLFAARLAELRGVGVDHIAQLTSANFTRLFLKSAP